MEPQYYVRLGLGGDILDLWKISDAHAERLGSTNPKMSPGGYFEARSGETVWDHIRQNTGWFEPPGTEPFRALKIPPGHYYPRMTRPLVGHVRPGSGYSPPSPNDRDYIASSNGQFSALIRQFDRICQTVEPTENNFQTYGHDIRNLLMLSCMEVEAHWRGILIANGVQKERFTRRDYVKLAEPMRLAEYAVALPKYPWIDAVSPFLGWAGGEDSTRNLIWYDAYNGVKHNREGEFPKATLENAIHALCACAIMIVSQFGYPQTLGQQVVLHSFFDFARLPKWDVSEFYSPSYEHTGRVPVSCPDLFP